VAEDSPGILQRLERWGTAAENWALVLLLSAMMVLAVGQIVLRLFFSFGFVWADELIKLMVLWIAMIASIAAARSSKHLRIDVLSHFVPERFARVPRILVEAFAAFMCGLLAWQSYLYVKLTMEFEDTVLVDVPAWIAYSVLPIAFGLMSYRFFLILAGEIRALWRPAESVHESR
jgi:TRAP-type C4-dicarboxylate transport system permease small subunit